MNSFIWLSSTLSKTFEMLRRHVIGRRGNHNGTLPIVPVMSILKPKQYILLAYGLF